MTLAETVTSILDGDAGEMRRAFRLWVASGYCTCNASLEARLVVAYELCRALYDDVSPMPDATCLSLAMVAGTTYARGADKLIAFCSRRGTDRFVQREIAWEPT